MFKGFIESCKTVPAHSKAVELPLKFPLFHFMRNCQLSIVLYYDGFIFQETSYTSLYLTSSLTTVTHPITKCNAQSRNNRGVAVISCLD